MDLADITPWVVPLAMGFALAATAGLRAFLPLLVVGLLARMGHVELAPAFAWMASTPALVVFASAVVFEVLGDKVPFFDHVLHAAGAFVAPVAGTLLVASLLPAHDPVAAAALGLASGGAAALAVHAARSTIRPLSTASTGGMGNPALSLGEDALALGGVATALLFPLLAAIVSACAIGLAIAFAVVLVRRARGRRNPAVADGSSAG